MKHYIGLDAHCKTSTFVSIDFSGNILAKAQVATTEGNLVRFLRSLKGQKSLTFEETNLAKWLHTILHKEADEVIVCQPAYLPKKRSAKGDFEDGLQMAQALRGGNLESVFHDDDNIFIPIRGLASSYRDIVSDITRSKNRLKAIFNGQGLKVPGASIYSQPERIDELSDSWNQISADSLMYQIQILETIKDRYLEEFKSNMKKYKLLRLLATLPGVDIVRANILAAYVCDGRRFKNKHVFWVYCGLARRKQISDGVEYGKDNHRGRPELKEAFMGIATSGLLSNSSFRRHYDLSRSQGLDHKRAKKSVARKAASIVLSIMKTNKPYDDKFEEKKKQIKRRN
jgi:transposase